MRNQRLTECLFDMRSAAASEWLAGRQQPGGRRRGVGGRFSWFVRGYWRVSRLGESTPVRVVCIKRGGNSMQTEGDNGRRRRREKLQYCFSPIKSRSFNGFHALRAVNQGINWP